MTRRIASLARRRRHRRSPRHRPLAWWKGVSGCRLGASGRASQSARVARAGKRRLMSCFAPPRPAAAVLPCSGSEMQRCWTVAWWIARRRSWTSPRPPRQGGGWRHDRCCSGVWARRPVAMDRRGARWTVCSSTDPFLACLLTSTRRCIVTELGPSYPA